MANQNPAGPQQEQARSKQPEQGSKGEQQSSGQQGQRGEASQRTGAVRGSAGLSRGGSRLPTFFTESVWRGSPFSLMRRMMEDMGRLYEEFAPGGERRDVQRHWMPFTGAWEPQVDVAQREGQLVIRADLPGLSKDDVRVEITDEGLVLEGERRSDFEEEREGIYRSERSYGSFRRVVPLPESVDASKAQARFDKGVLEITLPTPKEQQRGKRIEIQEGKGSSTPSQMH